MSALRPIHQLTTYPMTSATEPRYAAHAETVANNRAWQVFTDLGQSLLHAAQQIYAFIASLFVKVSEFFHDLFFKAPSSRVESPRFPSPFIPPLPTPIPDNAEPISRTISSEAVMFNRDQPLLININGLARVPRAISQEEMEQDLRAASTDVANLNELVAICHTLSPEHETRIANFIAFANSGGQAEYYLTLRSYFKGIIVEMRKDSVPNELKQHSLENLANGYYGCNAIRFNSVEKEYKRLSNRLPTPEDMILEAMQQFKEQIFINHYRLEHNPSFLNHIRREVGVELGLDRHPLYINDPQIENGPRRTREEYLEVFRNALTQRAILNRIGFTLNEMLRNPEYGRDLGLYMKNRLNQLEARGVIDDQQRDDLEDEYMPWGYQISESGTKFLLLQVGIFAHG
ncbi:MAG: hypothetical protein JSR39_06680 [Verrucomicrobia bacterium]|nr:hypothetical protein [Verrucomicrobiota bacterium]